MRHKFKTLIIKYKYAIIASSIICALCFSTFIFSINRAKQVPNAIEIYNEDDFYEINKNLSGYYVLADSITFSKPIQPIGSPEHPFTGTFDGLGRYNLKNIVFDFAQIDLEKYTYDGIANIGLFSFNQGIIIHNEITGVSVINADIHENKRINFGVICGSNKGKITSNTLYTPNGSISFSDADEICFGLFAGYNQGDIRRDRIIGHLNCSFSSINKIVLGGFSGLSCNNSVHEMLQFNGNISIYNSDDSQIDSIYCGSVVGICGGGEIKNCDLQKTSISNMKKNCNYSYCGGVIGYINDTSYSVLVLSCAIIGKTRSSAMIGNFVSSCIGKIEKNCIANFTNLLVGGECTNYYLDPNTEKISDLYYCENRESIVNNCKLLNDYQIKDPSINHIKEKISLYDLTISKMGWDDSFWSIENGVIHLKVFDL